jgi:hypothetical protein
VNCEEDDGAAVVRDCWLTTIAVNSKLLRSCETQFMTRERQM